MFDKILVPLDGSELAETAIPYVRNLAGQLGAEVISCTFVLRNINATCICIKSI